jgi:hypothetical protein
MFALLYLSLVGAALSATLAYPHGLGTALASAIATGSIFAAIGGLFICLKPASLRRAPAPSRTKLRL